MDAASEQVAKTFAPPGRISCEAHCSSLEEYNRLYKQSIEDPSKFWGDIAKQFYWKEIPENENHVLDYNFDCTKGSIYVKFMQGRKTNICYNVVDRNIIDKNMGDKVAFYWEGNDPGDCGEITYNELRKRVCRFANVLKSKGVKKGDRVAIYMPMIVELSIAMLACARIGAVHSIVFAGFSAHSLSERILDSRCSVLVTADGVWRGNKLLNLKHIADGAVTQCKEKGHELDAVIVARHLSPSDEKVVRENGDAQCSSDSDSEPIAKRPTKRLKIHYHTGRDCWWHEEEALVSDECEPVWLDAEDPLFILYTSGSTGKPKGVLHTVAGYMLYVATTTKYVFDYHPGDVYWCTADVGWITGHSYVVYGPLANGATSVIFEGTPFYPDVGRFWAVVDKYKVSKFYTAPTAIRSLMKFGDEPVKRYSRESLKVLGTVGEPINPEAWLWYHRVIGNERCAVVDTFWQTETGGHTLAPLPGATPTKPGSATLPFFGIVPALLRDDGTEIAGEGEGYLVFKQAWPGIMRTVYGNAERFETTYFRKFPGYYCTGDGARRDADGYLWVTGRIDDMLNVSGHLLSTAEVESALIEHPDIAECAVVAKPHDVKGECTYCFVTLCQGSVFSDELAHELKHLVRKEIGPFAQPEYIQEAPGLPKTRSGKIMRRVLRKIAVNDRELGDISTMADEAVVDELFRLRPKNA